MAENTSIVLAWGECDAYVKKAGDTTYKKEPKPVDQSTTVEPSEGEKLEAKTEGGKLEAAMQLANSYLAKYQLRVAESKNSNITHINGVVDSEFSLAIVPKNRAAMGVVIDRSSVSVLDSTFNSKEGIVDEFHFTALEPADGSKMVKRGVLTVTGDDTDGYTITGSGKDFE